MGKRGDELPALAQNLKRLRELHGLSQEQLAARANLSSVKMIESGKSVGSIQALIAIAEALGVTLDDLVADPSEMPPGLREFLASPGGQGATAEERERLRLIGRHRHFKPSQNTYAVLLMLLRSSS